MSDTRDRLQETAGMISTILPPGTGFVLLAFDFKPGGRLEYVSNGQRGDVVHAMQEFIDKTNAETFGKHVAGEFEFDKRIPEMKLWAWVGEDEFGSGEMGLKQGIVPAGCIPLVACVQGKIDQNYIKKQLEYTARQSKKPISLVRFCFERVEDQAR
jgi:hypothetical protein